MGDTAAASTEPARDSALPVSLRPPCPVPSLLLRLPLRCLARTEQLAQVGPETLEEWSVLLCERHQLEGGGQVKAHPLRLRLHLLQWLQLLLQLRQLLLVGLLVRLQSLTRLTLTRLLRRPLLLRLRLLSLLVGWACACGGVAGCVAFDFSVISISFRDILTLRYPNTPRSQVLWP
jgi:hypothetical protein